MTSFPEAYIGSSHMMNLYPEVILTVDDSPIRVPAEASGSGSSAGKLSQDSTNPEANDGLVSTSVVNPNAGSIQLDHEDNMTITKDDASLPSERDPEASDDDDDESPSGPIGELPVMRGTKRSFASSSSNPYLKSEDGSAGMVTGNTAKCPRISSAATHSTSSMDDPIGNYLAEMVDIERQWLEIDRERAENDRAMMMYMAQFLQAIASPNQSQ